ncbi:hypothetical protein JKL49_12485 [Phenylobacterium sp. 20VBR1]|uniref:DUF4136 domain-containing protein n=1 Tax=Phenylobacterium glaciei TaxID=2803784 RepID=A0A941HWL7_9CAUL|nr:hypothetical protein [Phenylobacterium glaciei]MBR7620206.1 hypothetical protein [Phenylobacterium glaciei]
MFKQIARRVRGVFAAFVLGVGLMAGTAAFAASYIDTSLPDLTPEQLVKVAQPKPVQLLFEFQTKGATNQRATTQIKAWVVDTAQKSGLFSAVGDAPTDGLLTITINNLPAPAGTASQGFVTGLTFGLKGTTVTDHYDCVIEYTPAPGAPKISRTLHHSIITTLGATSPPENAVKAKNIMAAVETMVRQVVAHGLNDLGADPAFGGVAPTPAIVPEPAAAPAAEPAPVSPPVAAQ